MTRVGHIDKEKYAEDALELLNGEKETFVSFAFDSIFRGVSREETRVNLVDRVKKGMRIILFKHLESTGAVREAIKYDYTYGYCRRIRREPRISEVPSKFLDIVIVLPNCNEVIESFMMEAIKLKMISDIQAKAVKEENNITL